MFAFLKWENRDSVWVACGKAQPRLCGRSAMVMKLVRTMITRTTRERRHQDRGDAGVDPVEAPARIGEEAPSPTSQKTCTLH